MTGARARVAPRRATLAAVAALLVAAIAGACSDGGSPVAGATPASGDAAASSSPSAVPAYTSPPASAAEGKALVEKLECNRCHAGTGTPEVAQAKHCFSCHVDIVAGKMPQPGDGAAERAHDPKLLAMWKPHVQHLRFVPSLSGLGTIVNPAWLKKFLVRPHDLRPGLHATMPRLPLDEHEAAAIAAYFAERSGFDEDSPAALPAGDIERGRGYFATKGCVGCHAFTGARTQAPPEVLPRDVADRALAPDLRYARDRVVPGRLAAWIRDPTAFKPDSAMPKQQLTPQEAEDLATFVLQAPLDDVPTPAAFARLPVLERPVGYDEVAKKVLHKICWHCHSQPDFARGDGGPGNTGGFGFAPRKLDLSSYESIAGGYLDASGKRRSVFSAAPSGEPMLLAVLLERTREERGAWSPLRGMPLGLPPLSPEDIQLVESWIAQGHPR